MCKKQWNFRKLNWDKFLASIEKSIPIIPDMAFQSMILFTSAMSKATHSAIPRGVCTYSAWTRKPRRYWTNTKNQEIQILLTTLLSLRTLQVVPDGKLELTSLIPAGKAGLFAVLVMPSALLNLPDHQSQQTNWHPISSRSPKLQQTRLSSVKYATDGTRHIKTAEDLRFQAILPGEGVSALGQMKFGTAPGYDFVHLVFLKHLGPSALTWLADLFTRMTWEQRIPKIWRQAKIVALAKPYKDAHLAASYRLVSLQPWKTFSVSIRLASAANVLPQGSLLAPSLFNLYTSDLPVTHSRRFIYANDICCALIQAETFSEIRVHKQLILPDTVSCGI